MSGGKGKREGGLEGGVLDAFQVPSHISQSWILES